MANRTQKLKSGVIPFPSKPSTREIAHNLQDEAMIVQAVNRAHATAMYREFCEEIGGAKFYQARGSRGERLRADLRIVP